MNVYRLRWIFEYSNGKKINGIWNMSLGEQSAHNQSREGLLYAVIEGENIYNNKIERLVEVEGHKYIIFQWLAETYVLPFDGKQKNIYPTQNIGLRLIATDYMYDVFFNGQINRKPTPNIYLTQIFRR